MNLTLVVLAAGMGSRYGGLKQLDPMGPKGETILDYSIRDAHRAGFSRVVFIIRREFLEDFERQIASRHRHILQIDYAFQELTDLPAGFSVPEGRSKPWGTTHALRAARTLLDGSFGVINADDYYGRDAYDRMAAFLNVPSPTHPLSSAMVGFPLQNTLSEHGSVNRGICLEEHGLLISVEEHTEIKKQPDGTPVGLNLKGQSVTLDPIAPVSMNFWGFTAAFLSAMEPHFIQFLKQRGTEAKAECYIPTVVDEMIREGSLTCRVLPTTSQWFGVTYPEDKAEVSRRLAEMEAEPQA
ncbi:MAG: NDP-sugar synthase [Candidatus Methylacidiphilales bacterium]